MLPNCDLVKRLMKVDVLQMDAIEKLNYAIIEKEFLVTISRGITKDHSS